MKKEIPIVNFGEKIPLSISIVQFDGVNRHMHRLPQLLINVTGESTLSLPDKDYAMKSGDIVIINSRIYHEVSAKGMATFISAFIDPVGFGLDEKEEASLSFNLNSMSDPDNPRINPIRFLIYSIIKYNTMENVNSIYTNRAIAYSFFAQLVNDFKTTNAANNTLGRFNSITTLTDYIENHFAEGLTLNALAEHFGFAVPYVSRLFKQALGKNFLDYYDEVRVNYSIDDLINGKCSIEENAKKYGFESAKSYVRAFKKIYGVYPSQYRKEEQSQKSSSFIDDEDVLRKQTLDTIIQSLDEYNASTGNRKESARETSFVLTCDLGVKGTPFSSPANRILSCDGVETLFIKENIREIEKETKELGIKTLRIKHLLGNDFPYLYRREDGIRHLQLPTLEKIIDQILSLGLFPYLELDYSSQRMPIQEYKIIVEEAIGFIAKRYHQEKLSHWKFAFTSDDLTDAFFDATKTLTEASRKICSVKIVSPSFPLKEIHDKGRRDVYLGKKIEPDFTCVCLHEKNSDDLLDKDFVNEEIKKLKTEGKWPYDRVIFVDSNFSSKETNLLYDTAFASSFIVKEEIDYAGGIYAFTYPAYNVSSLWRLDNGLFNGSHSFFEQGIKKPNYHALALLSKLGSELLKKEDGYLYTRKENGAVLLFSNYIHYSDLYAKNQYYELSRKERYRCFPKGTNANYHLELTHVPAKNIEVKITSLGRESGSCFDAWMSMGCPETMNEEEFATLKGLSEMRFHRSNIAIAKGNANLEFSLAPMDVTLIEITYVD